MALRTTLTDNGPSASWYELVACIGSGGMASTHLGRWRGAPHAPLVAIKRLHPHLMADETVRTAMLTEAAIGARIHHPNAVHVHEVEDLGTELLLIMDYVEGAALSDLLKRMPRLPRPIATRIVIDAAAGVSALHALCDDDGRWLGAVHRDIAPDNLLVGLDGATRITDFGVARCSGNPENMTQPGILKGKLPYMAPEYLMGYSTDARADVFALAVVAWELLAGRHPFRASTPAATMQRVARLEAPRLSDAAPEMGRAFDAVLGRAMAKNPAMRHGSMESFAAEFAQAASWVGGVASPAFVGSAVGELVGDVIDERRACVAEQLGPPSHSGVHPRPPAMVAPPMP